MTTDLNSTTPVRAGEELPVAVLESLLRPLVPDAHGPLRVEQFPHGHSNLTYLLRWGDREWVLRRPPVGNTVAAAHDMVREARILTKLQPHFPAAPKPTMIVELDGIGSSYLMERCRGVILRKSLPPGITIDSDLARRMSSSLVDTLAQLHAIDVYATRLDDLGKPAGYVQRQVAGWTKRYIQAQTSAVPAMDRLADWLNQHQPPDSGAAVIHNDYKYDNILLDPDDLTRIVAVLDWEMATIGDPLMDLGATLAYWVEATDPAPLRQAAFGPTALPGSLTRSEVVERYQQATGRAVLNLEFYYCFGLFKLAVIVQQIYARYARGLTQDPRFAHLDQLVAILSEQAERTLADGIG